MTLKWRLVDPVVDLEQPARRPLIQPMDPIAKDQLGHGDHHDLRVPLQERDESAIAGEFLPQGSASIRIPDIGTWTIVRTGDWPVPRKTARPVMPSRPIIAVSTDSPLIDGNDGRDPVVGK